MGAKGFVVNGWLVLDKPQGVTSTAAVGAAKRLFQARKVGHAGTLDPLATGVLPLAFGEATKTCPYVVDGEKSYRFVIRWGAETDTDDSEGRIVRTSERLPSPEDVDAVLPEFTGEIEQVPPQYSAVKVEGARAYDLARDGESFELASRRVLVHRLAVVGRPDAHSSELESDCSKGTYVRSLARDIGRRLGCLGHIVRLRRTRVGPFRDTAAIPLDKLDELGHSAAGREALLALLKPVEAALDDIPALSISQADASRLQRGQPILIRGAGAPILTGPAYAMSRGRLVAVGEIRQGELHPTRVFNFNTQPGGPPGKTPR